jgi:hypothetical protein
MEIQDWGKGHIDPFWDNEYLHLTYVHEPFNNSVDLQRWRKEGYVHPDSHFTGLLCDMRRPQPSWNNKLISWFESTFNVTDVGTSYYKMGTGVILPLHGDTYKKYRELFGCKLDRIIRALVMPEDWKSGHYLEIDGVAFTNWKAGDYFWWRGDVVHLAANIGLAKRYTIQLTGHQLV